jgi:hypothetical protein
LISRKLRTIFDQFNLGEHCLLEAPLKHRNKDLADFWFLFVAPVSLPVSNTASSEEVEELIQETQSLASVEIMNIDQPPRYAYCYIGDPLRHAIEEAKVTGIRFGTAKIFR